MRHALIDIGTNSVKLLVAEIHAGTVAPCWEGSEQTRLGQGFYEKKRLQAGAMAQSAEAVARFVQVAKYWKADWIRVIATSAVREAENQGELLEAVQRACGLQVEVISGEQEAQWVFAGVASDPALGGQSLLIMDVGGGSTEFILGEGAQPGIRASIPLGTVRLLEAIRPQEPPSNEDWRKCQQTIQQVVSQKVRPLLEGPLQAAGPGNVLLVGTGGTTSILGAMELKLTGFDRARIERVRLSRKRVREYREALWTANLAERRGIPGLPANRADVILFGVGIYAVVMDMFEFDWLQVSTRGMRFAAVMG